MSPLILANNLTVDFPIYGQSQRSVRRLLVEAATGGTIRTNSNGKTNSIRAIDDFSFSFKEGDRIGLIGHNGAGKTTLLRAIAGIYAPTSGEININGRVSTLLDIGLGLESESSGYENILLRGITLGLSTQYIKSKIEEIADFSELGNYLAMPLKSYSSGMLLRLAFSVSVFSPNEILVMDEWLSVGDENFNKKASQKLKEVIQNSSILVLASHSKDLIRQTCNRVFTSEHGKFTETSIESI